MPSPWRVRSRRRKETCANREATAAIQTRVHLHHRDPGSRGTTRDPDRRLTAPGRKSRLRRAHEGETPAVTEGCPRPLPPHRSPRSKQHGQRARTAQDQNSEGGQAAKRGELQDGHPTVRRGEGAGAAQDQEAIARLRERSLTARKEGNPQTEGAAQESEDAAERLRDASPGYAQ
jgi:hypothetical protein